MRVIAVILLIATAMLIAGCAAPEEKAPAPATKIQTKSLKDLVEAIDKGLVDVGDEYGLERFHKIHHDVLGLDCTSCHVGESYAKDVLLLNRHKIEEEVEEGELPGVVDKSVCLGCHKNGGVAPAFYGNFTR